MDLSPGDWAKLVSAGVALLVMLGSALAVVVSNRRSVEQMKELRREDVDRNEREHVEFRALMRSVVTSNTELRGDVSRLCDQVSNYVDAVGEYRLETKGMIADFTRLYDFNLESLRHDVEFIKAHGCGHGAGNGNGAHPGGRK